MSIGYSVHFQCDPTWFTKHPRCKIEGLRAQEWRSYLPEPWRIGVEPLRIGVKGWRIGGRGLAYRGLRGVEGRVSLPYTHTDHVPTGIWRKGSSLRIGVRRGCV
jgi:hypothetical protein